MKNFFSAIGLIVILLVTGRLHAQTAFPAGDYWSLGAGFGMTGILVKGRSYQGILDPKIWLSPPLMVGSRLGVGYSTDEIFSFEGQVYLRWNFLRMGSPEKQVNVFIQGGLGMLAAYRGTDKSFSNIDLSQTRGSVMADAAAGITIPLTSRWHIEPTIRGGYPHIAGFGITLGYKIPLPHKAKSAGGSSNRQIRAGTVEHIMFGPDTVQYNAGLELDAQKLNEVILNNLAEALKKNSKLQVRIEGHANPVTHTPDEAKRLVTISKERADAIARQLKAKGVSEDQMVIAALGGTRTITSNYDIRYRNRRVELILIQVDV
jgi:hypothetical protein